MEFDEQAAIDYIRKHIDESINAKCDDDEILNVIDIVWDYYDEHGMLEIDMDEDDDDALDVEALMKYAKKMVAKDRKSPFNADDVEAIVNAELDYEDTIF